MNIEYLIQPLTGDGHYSPIGGYDASRDLVLILDVARFKYPPYWVPLHVLWDSMKFVDTSSGQSRGYFVVTTRQGQHENIGENEGDGSLENVTSQEVMKMQTSKGCGGKCFCKINRKKQALDLKHMMTSNVEDLAPTVENDVSFELNTDESGESPELVPADVGDCDTMNKVNSVERPTHKIPDCCR